MLSVRAARQNLRDERGDQLHRQARAELSHERRAANADVNERTRQVVDHSMPSSRNHHGKRSNWW